LPLDCHHCIHYYVTWDENFPHGCQAMKFKSWRYPGDEVRMVFNGKDCLLYAPKKRKPKVRRKIDRTR
jgi:hypothetical protein